jgi:paraquat-inducible protein B
MRANWYFWLFPIIAVIICGWLFVDYFKQRGPTIKIMFEDASSIDAGKTKIRFRGVTIGMVKKIEISEDNKDVVVEAQLQRDFEHYAVEGSKFWVVLPKVNLQEVSGLETLFEGTYISLDPGPKDGKAKLEFRGQTEGRDIDLVDETSAYLLETENIGSVNTDDGIYYRGLKIGSVKKVSLSKTAQTVLVQFNVENKYTRLIRSNTVFWRKMGVSASLGLFKSEINVGSLDSLLHGGIELAIPDGGGSPAKALTRFPLHSKPPKDFDKWVPKLE